jgi:hypothetical protein
LVRGDARLAGPSGQHRTGRRQRGDCKINVSIENQRFTTLTLKTKKDSFPKFSQHYYDENYIFYMGSKRNLHEKNENIELI